VPASYTIVHNNKNATSDLEAPYKTPYVWQISGPHKCQDNYIKYGIVKNSNISKKKIGICTCD